MKSQLYVSTVQNMCIPELYYFIQMLVTVCTLYMYIYCINNIWCQIQKSFYPSAIPFILHNEHFYYVNSCILHCLEDFGCPTVKQPEKTVHFDKCTTNVTTKINWAETKYYSNIRKYMQYA